jgi:hypothetical protein
VVTVVSPHLAAFDAAWDDGPDAGAWIADRLAPFGAGVGHAVPLGYPAYAVVPIPPDSDATDRGCLPTIEALINVLEPFPGDQPAHFGIWEGWGWWYDTGTDPRTAPGMAVVVGWPEGDDRPAQEEIDRALADAREELAAERVERPDVEPLDLPHRRYYLWTGPLRSAMAFRQEPSLIWPEDRSWFIGNRQRQSRDERRHQPAPRLLEPGGRRRPDRTGQRVARIELRSHPQVRLGQPRLLRRRQSYGSSPLRSRDHYLPLNELLAHLRTVPWEQPDCVQLIVRPQHDDRWRIIAA